MANFAWLPISSLLGLTVLISDYHLDTTSAPSSSPDLTSLPSPKLKRVPSHRPSPTTTPIKSVPSTTTSHPHSYLEPLGPPHRLSSTSYRHPRGSIAGELGDFSLGGDSMMVMSSPELEGDLVEAFPSPVHDWRESRARW